jgi:hypothetical protein
MKFREKLKRLTQDINKASLCRRHGLRSTFIFDHLNIVKNPSIDSVAKIAKALEVDAGWLADDSKNWPPVYAHSQSNESAQSVAQGAA